MFVRKNILVYRSDSALGGSATEPDGTNFRSLENADFERSEIFTHKNRRENFVQRLSDGHECMGFVTSEGQVISYIWLSRQTAPFEMGLRFAASPTEPYFWDCRTAESYEGQGFYRLGLSTAHQITGLTRSWIVSDKTNLASQRGIEAAGFKQVCGFSAFKFHRPVVIRIGNKLRLFKHRGTVQPTLFDGAGRH